MSVHDLGQVLLVLDVLAVNGNDEVSTQHDRDVPEIGAFIAATKTGALRGAAGLDFDDEQAEVNGQAHLLGEFRTDRDGGDTQRRTSDAAESDQVIEHGFGGVDGDGKADARVLTDVGERSSY